MITATPYPLVWPIKQSRTRYRKRSRFDVTLSKALDDLADELRRARTKRHVLSTNVPLRRDGWPYANMRQPDDPGVALYIERAKGSHVLTCDAYNRVECNVRAVWHTLKALRTIERHGSGTLAEQAWSGFRMLHATGAKPWRDVLGLRGNLTIEIVTARYRELAARWHPDRPDGDADKFRRIVEAYQTAKGEL